MSMGSQREDFKEKALSGTDYCVDRNGTTRFGYKEGLWSLSFMLQVQNKTKTLNELA